MSYISVGWKGAALLEVKLYRIIVDHIFHRFNEMYQESLADVNSQYNRLQRFQLKLQEIKKWDSQKSLDEYNMLINHTHAHEILPRLLKGIFFCTIKEIINDLNDKITSMPQYTIPKAKSFIHKVYLETAKQLYSKPHYIENFPDEVKLMIKRAVSNSIKDLVPFDQLLIDNNSAGFYIQEDQIEGSIADLMNQIEAGHNQMQPPPQMVPMPPMNQMAPMQQPQMPPMPPMQQPQMPPPMPMVIPDAEKNDILDQLDPLSNIDLPLPNPAGNILQIP